MASRWLQIILLLVFISVIKPNPLDRSHFLTENKDDELFNKPQKMCGSQLSRVMNDICAAHNEPQRRKRSIAKDCCHSIGCSLKYLTQSYCDEINMLGVGNIIKEMKLKHQRRIENQRSFNNYQPRVSDYVVDNPKKDYIQVRNETLSRRFRHRTLTYHESPSATNHENHNHQPERKKTGQKKRQKQKCSCRKRREKVCK